MKAFTKILLSFTVLIIFSCEDYLDRLPLNNPSDATFLASETELNLAIAGCYSALWLKEQEMPFQLSFDQATDIGWDRNGSSLTALGRGAADSRNGTATNLWGGLYKGISRCNYVLEHMDRGIEKVNPQVFKKSMAEARFLRALLYHYLIELYGDVPLVKTTLALPEAQMEKTAKSAVADFILTELEEASADLPVENNPVSGRATKGAALAIKSRVALYNEKWDVAIKAAQDVMALEGSEYILNDNYGNLFLYAGQSSKEIIFSVQYLKGTQTHAMYRLFGSRNGQAHTNKKPAYQLSDVWECIDGLQIDESPLFDPKHPYQNRDPRLGYTIAVSGSQFLGFQFETHGDSLKCWNYNVTPATRIANLEATHAYASFTGICWRKYADNLDRAAINESELNTIIIRYAEVLLNYAEAKIEAGQVDQSVVDAINKVRQRKSVEMPPILLADVDAMRNVVRRERLYELAGEGLRLFDIRRWKIAEDVMSQPVLGRMKKSYPDVAPKIDALGSAHYDNIPIAQSGESADFKMRVVEVRSFDKERDYLWPIPQTEIETNKKITQNSNY